MFKDKIIFQMKSNNPIQKAVHFCNFLPNKNLFVQENHLKSKMSQLNDLSGTNSYYQKVYYCQSPQEVDAIKNRNLIKCTSLPKFQIIRENMNQITVKMAKYSFNGLEVLIKNLKRPAIAKKLIAQIFKAVNTIQRFYGEFQITGTKIKADAAGNIAVWPTQNFEQCLPIKYSHNQNSNQSNIVSKIKSEKFLKQLKNAIAQVILETGTQKDQKQIYCKLDQLTKNILFGNLYNQEIFQKPEKQKFKEYNAKSNNTNYRVENKLEVSEFQYFFPKKHLGWRNSVAVVQCQQENQQRLSFQFGHTGSLEFNKIPNVFAGRMSNYQSQRTNFLRVKSLEKKQIEPIQKKVPQFIKQKQKIKTSPELREVSKKWDKIDLEQQYDLLINGKSDQQKVTKGFSNVQLQVSIFFDEDEEQIDTAETEEQVEHENFLSPATPGSKKKTLKQFTITRTKSTFKIEKPQKQQKPQQNLFLPKLTVLQQNQLNEDFLKIFSSRKNIYQDGVLGMQNLQLKRQFMLLMD